MIKDIMNKNIVSGEINDSVSKISELMKDNNIGFIPIKDNEEYFGVVTDRDIALIIPYLKNKDDCIKPYISNGIITIDSSNSFHDALNLMSKEKIKRLLVKDGNSIVGVVTLSDILNNYESNKIIKTYKSIFYIHDNDSELLSDVSDFYL